MFRTKKSAGNGADNGSGVVEPTADVTAPPPEPQELKIPVRRTPPPVIRPLPPSSSPLDLTRRPGEVVGASPRSEAPASQARDKALIVGKDVEFSGEIKACQKLIVEGVVQINSSDCRLLQVGPTGVFRGRIEVTEAEILGRFEGELVVHERLVIRATGQATGKIRYGTIVIDAGGQVAGEVSTLDKRAAAHATGEIGADVFTIPGATAGSTAAVS
jgi:Integral membrane protein CcmA involved in cell shape determination